MSQSVLVPYYKIYINGKEIDEYRYSMLGTLEIEDNASGSDSLSMSFSDPELRILSDNIFKKDAKVKVQYGWYQGSLRTFEGYISVIEADFPENGVPSIQINCMDNSYNMNKEKRKRTWTNQRASDIAKTIFKEYGMTYTVDTTPTVLESESQSDTDIQFLLSLADAQVDRYIVYVEGKHGYFVKKNVIATPSHTFSYRQDDGNLLSFSPVINKYTKQASVTCSEVNQDNNTVVTTTSNNSNPRPTTGETYNPDPTTSNNTFSEGQTKMEYDPLTGKWIKYVYKQGKWVKA